MIIVTPRIKGREAFFFIDNEDSYGLSAFVGLQEDKVYFELRVGNEYYLPAESRLLSVSGGVKDNCFAAVLFLEKAEVAR